MNYTKEEHAFLKEFIPGHHHKEIVEEFNKRFRNITEWQVKSYIKNNKIRTGFTGSFKENPQNMYKPKKGIHLSPSTEFKKGNRSCNWVPVGTESITSKDHYIKVKVAEPGTWELKHILVWKEHHGEIPEGCKIIFKDNDRNNCSIENLICISQQENLILNQTDLHNAVGEAKEAAVLTAKLISKTRQIERKRNNGT